MLFSLYLASAITGTITLRDATERQKRHLDVFPYVVMISLFMTIFGFTGIISTIYFALTN